MQTGIKRGPRPSGSKSWVQRHGSKRGGARRSYAAAEKAIETAARRGGKREIKTQLSGSER